MAHVIFQNNFLTSMSVQHSISICRNDFQSSTTSIFRGLRENVEFSDVTLACEDGQVLQAHQVLLASSSSVFANMLKDNIHSKPIIFMHGLRMSNMSQILDYIYKGEAKVSEEDVDTFMNLAKDLRLEGLSDKNVQMGESKKIGKKRKVPKKRRKAKSSEQLDEKDPNMTNPLFENEKDDVKNFGTNLLIHEIAPTGIAPTEIAATVIKSESESNVNNVAFSDEADVNPVDFEEEAKKAENQISQQLKEQLDRWIFSFDVQAVKPLTAVLIFSFGPLCPKMFFSGQLNP